VLDAIRPVGLRSGGALHVTGCPGAQPLLLLHGVGGGAWSWRPQREALAPLAQVFALDVRGHGAAARVLDAGLADYYADVREALAFAHQETRRRVVLAGHSMGGLLAIALAADEPDAVAGLALVDPVYATGREPFAHTPASLAAGMRWLSAPLTRSVGRNGTLSRLLARWMFAQAFEDPSRREQAWRDQCLQIPLEYPRILDEAFSGPRGFPLRDFAAEISAPTLLLEGTHGRRRPRFPALVATLDARLGRRFRREVIAGGHYLQLDRPDAVNAALTAFLGDLP
jgi:3-oxoadipate enol-lactonase